MRIEIATHGNELATSGLARISHPEIRVIVPDLRNAAWYEQLLRFLAAYVSDSNVGFKSGETVAYGYWLLQMRAASSGDLEIWERTLDGTDFTAGASLAVKFWSDQRRVCETASAAFEPPRPDLLAAISKGVLEGHPVEGVRYPSPAHMSGWWFFTDQYSGDVSQITTTHLIHISNARQDLARYFALPPGFRFSQRAGGDVWFDEEVAAESPI